MLADSHTSSSPASGPGSEARLGITPTTVRGASFTKITRPRIAGSAP
jgi:hypothetical protein